MQFLSKGVREDLAGGMNGGDFKEEEELSERISPEGAF